MKKMIIILLLTVYSMVSNAQYPPYVIGFAGQSNMGTGDVRASFIGGQIVNTKYTSFSFGDVLFGMTLNNNYYQLAFPKPLGASKGYFSSYVELKWDITRYESDITAIKVFRKELGSPLDSSLVASLSPADRIWYDGYSQANTLYKYTVYAQGIADAVKAPYINYVEGIGFRSPFGIVNGQIKYEGDVPVSDVKILAQPAAEPTGSSLFFNGFNSYAEVSHKQNLMPTSAFTIETWVKIENTDNATIINKSDATGGYGIGIEDGKEVFWINNGAVKCINNSDKHLQVGLFGQITAVYNGASMSLYINGDSVATVAVSATIVANEAPLYFGKKFDNTDFFKGSIDETRFFTIAKTSAQIVKDHCRFLNQTEVGMVAYWRINETFGEGIYDYSKTGTLLNFNDGILIGAQWSTDFPPLDKLGAAGFTDSYGNYSISGIEYTGSGQNYTITPFFNIHKFEPSQKSVYIGEGSNVLNNTNFTDKSSFKVTGSLKYTDCDCYVKDAFLKIDGEIVIKNNAPVKTKADGSFEMDVPIGLHSISLEMSNHDFAVGQWPVDGSKHNFQAPVSGIEFIDSTRYTLIGRVVGGTREGTKKLGFAKSKNNIGIAVIKFESEQGNGCFTKQIKTDSLTGEYVIKLPPLRYKVSKLEIPSNLSIDFGVPDIIDLSLNYPTQELSDTTFNEDSTAVVSIKKINYHHINNYIYRSDPSLSVTNMDNSALSGDSKFTYTDPKTKEKLQISLSPTNPFPYSIFTQLKPYKAKISVFEPYTNKDGNPVNPAVWVTDQVPVNDGQLIIDNELTDNSHFETKIENGQYIYSFNAGNPNIALNTVSPELSFTKTMIVTLKVGSKTSVWPSITTPYRGFVLGAKPQGSNFVTKGPELVDFILRDPPGSGSYTTLEKGSSTTEGEKWSSNYGGSLSMQHSIYAGAEFSLGIGMQTQTDIENNIKTQVNISAKSALEGERTTTNVFTESFSTSSESDFVGADADVFVGKSQNMTYGLTDIVTLIDDEFCVEGSGAKCYDMPSVDGLKLGIKPGMWIAPTGYGTMFTYTQNHIKNYLIPNLKTLRNALFINEPAKYVSQREATHSDYGWFNLPSDYNREDGYALDELFRLDSLDAFGNQVYDGFTYWDSYTNQYKRYNYEPLVKLKRVLKLYPYLENGNSYQYNRPAKPDPLPDNYKLPIDSVNYYNTQIMLWEKALARNEYYKIESKYSKNVSFDAGTAYSSSQSEEYSFSETAGWEVSIEAGLAQKLQAKVNGAGLEIERSLLFTMEKSGGKISGHANSTTYSYNLADVDEGDYYSVDIYTNPKDGCPIFKLRGGQSSCPYVGETKTQYYKPNTIISEGTMQREVPEIAVTSAPTIFNVPEHSFAAFTFQLTNNSQTGEDRWYEFVVKNESNPNGVQILMDGGVFDRRMVLIPGKSSIIKTVNIGIGSGTFDYEGLTFALQSSCDDIADEASVNVHFVPGCSPVAVKVPSDLWVANYENNNKVPIVINNYNVNNTGFENIKIQYKPSSSSKWVNLETFWKDTVGMNNPELKLIPAVQPYIQYEWNVAQMIDSKYDLRAVTTCELGEDFSSISTGVIDRVNPTNFGSPQPADGILSAGDDITVQLNEPVNTGMITLSNIDARGVLNGYRIDHNVSVAFNGTTSFVKVPDGINLRNKSLSVEMWVRRATIANECLLTQGTDTSSNFYLGFDASGKFVARIGTTTILSENPLPIDNTWHHFAFVYNKLQGRATMYDNGALIGEKLISSTINDAGVLYVGKKTDKANAFTGNIHELRIWYKAILQTDLVKNYYKALNGNEVGLSGYWPMNEAFGKLLIDKSHRRNAQLNATWEVSPAGKSIALNGVDQYVKMSASYYAFNTDNDFTLECWFKGLPQNATLLSIGKGVAPDTKGWSINTYSNGKIKLINNNLEFVVADTNYLDNNWHHLAVVVTRLGNTNAFIDGKLTNSASSQWTNFGGAALYAGVRAWYEGAVLNTDNFFNGKVDEIRMWGLARKQEQINRFMVSRLSGDEPGLVSYFPFENYETDLAGIQALNPSMKNIAKPELNAIVGNAATYSADAPTIKLMQAVQKVNYTYVTNVDKIAINLTDPSSAIENTTLDFTVKGLNDLNANVQQSPITWSAYIRMNQIRWEEQELILNKELYQPLTFTATVSNTGGKQQSFTIDNIPVWMSASPKSGVIEPLKNRTITFTVDEGLNPGYYSDDLYLRTDFGFDEKLPYTLTCLAKAPDWKVDPAKYQYSMNVIAQIKINGILSSDINDKVAAFVGKECRGVVNLLYIEKLDLYEAYIDIFSNREQGDTIKFFLWDASEGDIIAETTPTYIFIPNSIKGTPQSPIIIEGIKVYESTIALKKGWNWLSFNLLTNNNNVPNKLFVDLLASDGDLLKGQKAYDLYTPTIGWTGGISGGTGLKSENMYMLKLNVAQNITYRGIYAAPTTPIAITDGWNWIGYIPKYSLSVADAFGLFTSQNNDVVKSQTAFAMYSNVLGWVGSLKYLKAGEGYMYKSSASGTLVFPEAGLSQQKSAKAISIIPWKMNGNDNQYTMSVVAKLNDETLNNQQFVLGAFNTTNCVGSAEQTAIKNSSQKLFFISVSGNSNEKIGLKLKTENGSELIVNESVTFKSNDIVGTIDNPIILTINNTSTQIGSTSFSNVTCYPTLFSDYTTISYKCESNSNVSIEILNQFGLQVKSIPASNITNNLNTVRWDGTSSNGSIVSAGVYYIRVSANGKVQTIKVVKL